MESLDKYLELKFKFDPSPDELSNYNNCLGLAKEFYQDHSYSQIFDDGNPWPIDRHTRYIQRLISYFDSNFVRVKSIDELSFGDIVLLYTGAHVGIYLGDHKILAFEEECIDYVSVTKVFTVEEIGMDNIRFCYKRD